MRSKEEAHDYRYFPDPDLVDITIERDEVERLRKSLPELPDARRERLALTYKIETADAEILALNKPMGDYYEEAVGLGADPKLAANWLVHETGSVQISDEDTLVAVIDQVLSENPQAVEDLQNGQGRAIGFLVGQIMRLTKGKANPEAVNKLIRERLA
jgi:aspartyl-tRNA(Asn)/glutamyl-tRNA(Gln) amidotransferase subunit B